MNTKMKIPRANTFSNGVQEADKNQTTTATTRKKNTKKVPIPIKLNSKEFGLATTYGDIFC